MNFWKDKTLWIYECGLGSIFMIVALLAFIQTRDLQGSLFFFIKMFALMQPVILGAHFVDKKYRKRENLPARSDKGPDKGDGGN